MSGRRWIVDEVREHLPRDLHPTVRLVFHLLAERAYDRDRLVKKYPLDRIAWDAGITPRQARRAIDELESRCLVERTLDPSTLHRGMCQTYRIEQLKPAHRFTNTSPVRGVNPDPEGGHP